MRERSMCKFGDLDYYYDGEDNSGGEYGEGQFEISYCPICGRKLVEE